jgi:hypothetical protein
MELRMSLPKDFYWLFLTSVCAFGPCDRARSQLRRVTEDRPPLFPEQDADRVYEARVIRKSGRPSGRDIPMQA